jgi:hypothetical protein
MAIWSDWLPDLLPQLPECPVPLIEHELLRAAQDFFSRSYSWIVTTSAIPVVAAEASAPITFDPMLNVDNVRIEQAWYDNKEMELTTPGDLDSRFQNDWNTHVGVPYALYQESPGSAAFYPIPTAPSVIGFRFRASVKPTDASTGIPDDLYSNFKDEILVGAKARLMLFANKAWSNPGLGAAYAAQFEQRIDAARRAAAKSFGRSRLHIRATMF